MQDSPGLRIGCELESVMVLPLTGSPRLKMLASKSSRGFSRMLCAGPSPLLLMRNQTIGRRSSVDTTSCPTSSGVRVPYGYVRSYVSLGALRVCHGHQTVTNAATTATAAHMADIQSVIEPIFRFSHIRRMPQVPAAAVTRESRWLSNVD